MNVNEMIRQLRLQHEKLDRCIAALEDLQPMKDRIGSPPQIKRRGRKSMRDPERQKVSARMKQYWAARRKQEDPPKLAT